MTKQELQELSRKAAGYLPKDFHVGREDWFDPEWLRGEPTGKMLFKIDGSPTYDPWYCWLHESNDACVEIMTKILWPAGISIEVIDKVGAIYTGIKHDAYGDNIAEFTGLDASGNFRACVLMALINLRKQQ